jgi:putative hydrolase of the HAD superfamily
VPEHTAEAKTPRAALFDSGGVLMRPVGGRWNPRADFEQTVLAQAPWVTPGQMAAAIAAGDEFMAAAASTPGLDDYHRVILRHLGVRPAPELLAVLRRPVAPAVFLELFPDVRPTLGELRRRGVPMAVVSDAWPDLPRLHDGLGIGGFFGTYAISAVLGFRKPDPRIYRHASDALGLAPGQCLFIDDDPALVSAAIGLGYHGRALCRDGRPGPGVPSIASLTEVLDLI